MILKVIIMKYLAIIFDGFEEEEAMAPFALIRRANGELTIVGINTTVCGSHNIKLTDITLLNKVNPDDYDVLIIPGGGGQYKALMTNNEVLNIINNFYKKGKYLCGICAAPTVFGALGLLKGKNYTCFTSMNQDFGGFYHDKGVVVDGKLITARSVAYSIEFAYTIIKETLGEETLKSVWKQIYYEE